MSEKGAAGNALHGNVVVEEVPNSYVRSSGRLIDAVGVEDLVIVATDDPVMVASRGWTYGCRCTCTVHHAEH